MRALSRWSNDVQVARVSTACGSREVRSLVGRPADIEFSFAPADQYSEYEFGDDDDDYYDNLVEVLLVEVLLVEVLGIHQFRVGVYENELGVVGCRASWDYWRA